MNRPRKNSDKVSVKGGDYEVKGSRRDARIRRVLRMIRVGAGLTTESLAHGINVDRSFISRVESGGAPLSSDVIADWVDACGGNALLSGLIEGLQAMQQLADLFGFDNDHAAYA